MTRKKELRHAAEYRQLVERLKFLRKNAGMTQSHVASILGLSRSQYTAIEAGRSLLNFDQLYSLGEVFDISLHDLLKDL